MSAIDASSWPTRAPRRGLRIRLGPALPVATDFGVDWGEPPLVRALIVHGAPAIGHWLEVHSGRTEVRDFLERPDCTVEDGRLAGPLEVETLRAAVNALWSLEPAIALEPDTPPALRNLLEVLEHHPQTAPTHELVLELQRKLALVPDRRPLDPEGLERADRDTVLARYLRSPHPDVAFLGAWRVGTLGFDWPGLLDGLLPELRWRIQNDPPGIWAQGLEALKPAVFRAVRLALVPDLGLSDLQVLAREAVDAADLELAEATLVGAATFAGGLESIAPVVAPVWRGRDGFGNREIAALLNRWPAAVLGLGPVLSVSRAPSLMNAAEPAVVQLLLGDDPSDIEGALRLTQALGEGPEALRLHARLLAHAAPRVGERIVAQVVDADRREALAWRALEQGIHTPTAELSVFIACLGRLHPPAAASMTLVGLRSDSPERIRVGIGEAAAWGDAAVLEELQKLQTSGPLDLRTAARDAARSLGERRTRLGGGLALSGEGGELGLVGAGGALSEAD